MKYQLRFTTEEMRDIQLLARSQGIALDDYTGMAEMVGKVVAAKLDEFRQPKPAEEAK